MRVRPSSAPLCSHDATSASTKYQISTVLQQLRNDPAMEQAYCE